MPPVSGAPAGDLPSGTVTLLFSDIEASTRLSRTLGRGFADVIETHRRLLREAFARRSGIEVGTEGDSFFVAFEDAAQAVRAAVEAQRLLQSHPWPRDAEVRVRMGLHTGTPVLVGGDYLGYEVHRASRISSSAHGGQVVVSEATWRAADDVSEDGIGYLDLGQHRLKDLDRPEHVYQLVADGLLEQFPPLRSLSPVRNNLPYNASSFVGRESELRRLLALVEQHRLVTVTGPGGTGKTRLALEAARTLTPQYPDGIWFVELGLVTDPQLVAHTTALTIGLRDMTGRQPVEAIAQYAEGKRMLLVLDNFEQVMAAAPTVGELIRATSGLDVLVTSREVLHLRGERELRVPPLPLPTRPTGPVAELAKYESVRLFVERTRETVSDFQLTEDNAAAIASICRRLDGLPLAIELVVARIKVQSPRELLRRLDRTLALLTSGSRDLPERQRTLRTTIEWSFDLLDREEQLLLARLSVFHGRVDMGTVETVCGADIDVVTVLAALVDKSLVQHGPGRGEAVFWMLLTVREFAQEKLAEHGEQERCLTDHAEHYRGVAEQAAKEIFAADQVAWLSRIDRDVEDLQAAIRWSLETGAVHRAAAIAEGVHACWWIRGNYGSGRYWLGKVLAAGVDDDALRAKVLVGSARLAMQQSAFEEANAALLEAGEIARTLEDELLCARVLSERFALHIKSVAFGVEDPPEEALAVFRRAGDVSAEGELLIRIGGALTQAGRLSEAVTTFEQAATLLRPTDNLWATAAALNNIGFLIALEGRFSQALPLLHESLEMYRAVGTKDGLATVSDSLALALTGLGELDEAIVFYEQAAQLLRDMGNRLEMASVLVHMGRARTERGDLTGAATCLREALDIAVAPHMPDVEAFAFDGIGALLLRSGQPAQAARLFAAAAVLRAKEAVPLAPADQDRLERDLARLAEQVSAEERAAASAWAEATPREAVAEAALAATRSVAFDEVGTAVR